MHHSLSNLKIVFAILGILALVLVGFAAATVGGIAIRSTGSSSEVLQLSLSDPALRGVPVAVRWAQGTGPAEIELVWRTREGETFVGHGSVSTLATRITLPCTGTDTGTLLAREVTSGKILGSLPLTLLAPTVECLR